MRKVLLALAALIALAIPATASASSVGTATTTDGKSLRVSIDSPSDGLTIYGTPVLDMQGYATIDGSPDSAMVVKVGVGDAYEAAGSTDYGSASYNTYNGNWTTYNKIAYE